MTFDLLVKTVFFFSGEDLIEHCKEIVVLLSTLVQSLPFSRPFLYAACLRLEEFLHRNVSKRTNLTRIRSILLLFRNVMKICFSPYLEKFNWRFTISSIFSAKSGLPSKRLVASLVRMYRRLQRSKISLLSLFASTTIWRVLQEILCRQSTRLAVNSNF